VTKFCDSLVKNINKNHNINNTINPLGSPAEGAPALKYGDEIIPQSPIPKSYE